jgi:RNA polymerase sigma factor (sigma-70 family)
MFKGSVARLRFRQLEDLFHTGIAGDLSDSELLDRFLRCRDQVGEAAFTALVERHGPMVFRVCKQALNDHHSAQDAVQATFLVLARHAGAIRRRPSVSSWLFGVARRASARIRMEKARRQRYELRSLERSSALISAPQEFPDPDPYPELHAEIQRLPEKYREPIVLCYFVGLTHEQAATRLRWPLGTVKIRLSRARERLRSRLERRGRAPQILLPASPLQPGNVAALPENLVNTISRAASQSATKGIAGGLVSAKVVKVTQGVLQSMLFDKLKIAVVVLSGLSLLGFGALVAARQVTGKRASGQARDTAIDERNDSPYTLKLVGSTDYDPATVTVVRTPLDCRVDKVFVDLGSTVKTGDPLLELFSFDLAEAKSNYEAATSQWARDKKALDYKTPLAMANSIPRKELIEVENDEAQSRLKMKLAKDKLLVYGLTDKEIENAKKEDGVEKAKMILRSRGYGVVVQRSVVPGNYYASGDLLMTIATLDHLWVRGSVSELDAEKVKLGQKLTVIFPVSNQKIDAVVNYIDKAIDADSRSAKFRTTISNPGGQFKAGMFVRLVLETGASRDRIDEPRAPGEKPPHATGNDRLSELERKVERLLSENAERSAHAKILDRLDALERKLDRLLNGRNDAQP